MKNRKFTIFSITIFIFAVFVSAATAQVDVPRKTLAITYPLDDEIEVSFRGTTRFPRMKGEAKIKRTKKNGTEIRLSISKMPRPFELGKGYATYVLWAISPNGQVDNLGEIKRRGFWEFDSTIKVTTPLQTFALIVTAEPHFLVSRPSQAIMLENLRPYSKNGKTISTITSIQYFGNSSDYFRDPRTPEIAEVDYKSTPPSVLQAQQAVALAKYAGAERDAPDELTQAETFLKNAENGWTAGRGEEYVDIEARKSIGSAVLAETTAIAGRDAREKRNEKMRQDAELKDAEDKYAEAQQEIARLNLALNDETRSRELTERDKINYLDQINDLKKENKALRDELEQYKIKFAQQEAEKKIEDENRLKEEKTNQIVSNEPILINSLKRFGTVSKSDVGIILTLNENIWTGIRVSSFDEKYATKLDELGTLLANTPNYKFVVESHTDNEGTPDELDTLTTERARAVADKLMAQGVTETRLESKGYGATIPVSPNTTRSNRAKNRRVYVILIPNV
ncbi:MAG: OmpA family protein [Pyrinomonadaceae bacterium]